MIYILLAGMLVLTGVALGKGHSFRETVRMAAPGVKDSFIVIGTLLLIGCLTGLWRISGTVACFITLGIRAIPARLFVLAAFLLTSGMSFAIGTSFGVVATAGVILMGIARAGNVNPVIAAGAIMSGLYLGDRGSPAASSASLVAAVTKTSVNRNVRKMLKTALLPFCASVLIYGALSVFFPLEGADSSVTESLEAAFSMNPVCLLPALLMIVLPFAGVKVRLAMGIDILVSAAAAVLLQRASPAECLHAMLLGYETEDPLLSALLTGGGIRSMLQVCLILLISGTYGGLFRITGLLARFDRLISRISAAIGRFGAMCLLSLSACAVFCNQTIGVIMVNQLSSGLYGEEENEQKMIDLEDSVIVIAGLVPWCIACSVPLATLEAGIAAVPLAVYLWLLPLWRMITGKRKTGRSIDTKSSE